MTSWTVMLPVKPWRLAKSRLNLSAGRRERIARSMTMDVLETILSTATVGAVVIVSTEQALRGAATEQGAVFVEDRGLAVRDPLNAAVGLGRSWAVSRRPDSPLVVVPCDLPAMTSPMLQAALGEMALHVMAHVSDLSGQGTTLLAAARPSDLVARYGHQSAKRHLRLGSVDVEADAGVRLDVDTVGDLAAAAALGVGGHTRGALDTWMLARR